MLIVNVNVPPFAKVVGVVAMVIGTNSVDATFPLSAGAASEALVHTRARILSCAFSVQVKVTAVSSDWLAVHTVAPPEPPAVTVFALPAPAQLGELPTASVPDAHQSTSDPPAYLLLVNVNVPPCAKEVGVVARDIGTN